MVEKPFSIRSRAEFDDFWISGIELGQMLSLDDLRALSTATSVADLGLSATPATALSPLDDPPVTAQVWWSTPSSRRAPRSTFWWTPDQWWTPRGGC